MVGTINQYYICAMKIGIIGSGTMGAGIAQVAAQHGNTVIVIDTNQVALDKAKGALEATLSKLVDKQKLSQEQASALQSNITWSLDKTLLNDAALIIEAIVEDLGIKQKLFEELESIVSEDCILATNTSSISVTSIASACKHAERVIGIHFFNPAPLMELVEIIPAIQTANDITSKAKKIIDAWGKKTVLAKDMPGFIVNRIARPYYSEALRILDEGIASKETIDFALKQYGGFRMGPFELMDMIGHDVNYVVTETVWKSFYFDTRYTPSFTQKRLVEAKWYGRKSGRGFYDYREGVTKADPNTDESQAKQILNRVLAMLINEAAHALYMNLATKEDIDLAMTKGVNYPKGLLVWADEWGISQCVSELDTLYKTYNEDRYRCTPLLRTMLNNNQKFY